VVDWAEWHRHYDDPTNGLTRRLAVVKSRLSETLDVTGAAKPRVLALCAGEGRDVVPVLASRRPGQVPAALLVEREPGLAQRARDAAAAARLEEVEVRCADAGNFRSFADFLPVEVLMLCGVFGHLDDVDLKGVVSSVPQLVRGGGRVIWTRGRSDPDMRPVVRGLFHEAGLPELSFNGDPEDFGVGVNAVPVSTQWQPPRGEGRFFTFRTE
jgi:SAM-dependent methyltransferase